ncbi:MAG: aspartyl protease family protein [Mariniphaga sp.]|nr:aspartyl protease family protein [Mariniphaga sp.]
MEKGTIIWALLISLCLIGVLVFTLTSCLSQEKIDKTEGRKELLNKIDELKLKYSQNPENLKIAAEYARKLFTIGDFIKSQEVLKPLITNPKATENDIYLFAHIAYLQGRYSDAEKLADLLFQTGSDAMKVKAQVALAMIYYQTKQYGKAKNLFHGLEGKIQLALWDLMKSYDDEIPYQIDWNESSRTSIHFLKTDPLPVVAIEINGKQINCIIDTGGELFYLDETVANSMGIKPVANQMETFAGGKTIEVGYAKVDNLKLGSVTIKSVPIKTGKIKWIQVGGDLEISGIITTGILQQFLSTMDYINGELVLRPRSELGREMFLAETKGKDIVEIPFVLALTHIMIVRGQLNGKGGFNLFLDSGLADESAAILLPEQTMNYLGIPLPVMETIPEESGGLAGGGFTIGRFTMENVGLASLQQKKVGGLYGVFPPTLYMDCEFIVDGLISHQYLKNYSWTIDFSRMVMAFSK